MVYSVTQKTIARTIWCEKEHVCLQQGHCDSCARCEIVGENAINALFLRNAKSPGCPYFFDFGSAFLCTCPTRYAIYKKYGC